MKLSAAIPLWRLAYLTVYISLASCAGNTFIISGFPSQRTSTNPFSNDTITVCRNRFHVTTSSRLSHWQHPRTAYCVTAVADLSVAVLPPPWDRRAPPRVPWWQPAKAIYHSGQWSISHTYTNANHHFSSLTHSGWNKMGWHIADNICSCNSFNENVL